MICRSAVATMFLAPQDVLFHPQQIAQKMHFVESGKLHYELQDVHHVHPRECFGEATLWTQWLYLGFMRAMIPCVLVSVRALEFFEAVKQHPETFMFVKHYAIDYVHNLNDTKEQDLTDLGKESINIEAFQSLKATRQSSD